MPVVFHKGSLSSFSQALAKAKRRTMKTAPESADPISPAAPTYPARRIGPMKIREAKNKGA
jgi:hypothetical protein